VDKGHGDQLSSFFAMFVHYTGWNVSSLKALRILPILVLWGISNSGIFVNKVTPTFKVSQQALALLHH
jgi:hypothetical protein